MASPIIPNRSFFPTSLIARAAWYANFNTMAQAEGLNYGLAQANVDQMKDDNNMMQFMASSSVSLDAYGQAWTAFRNSVTTGTIGEPTADIPTAPTLLPPTSVPTGIFQRINEYRDIVRASLKYTKEVGEAWGIEPTNSQPISPADVKPTINVFEAATGYHFSVVAGKREAADAWNVLVLRKGAAGWALATTATGKSVDVTLVPSTPGDPEQMQVRVQLRKSNADYGQPSDIVYVTVNP